jgi:sugar phosphate isomerase/epimerase
VSAARPAISVFPKCYFDALCRGEMAYVDWIRAAATLGGEGLEHYDGFFRGGAEADLAPALAAMAETGQISSMLCFSPDFTHPLADERTRQVERQQAAVDLAVRLGTRFCRTLSGQRRPGLTRQEGIAWTVDALQRSVDYAARRDVVLCLENHYKDGTWRYPEFAQPEDIYLEILARVDSPHLGVQYDPSNALVGGYDPIGLLKKVLPRVVTMHASDRALAPGATLDDLRDSDGAVGYSDKLIHGEVGAGLIDYDAVFRLLAGAGYAGWISVEDGMNGLDELARSVAFLKRKRDEHFGPRLLSEIPPGSE